MRMGYVWVLYLCVVDSTIRVCVGAYLCVVDSTILAGAGGASHHHLHLQYAIAMLYLSLTRFDSAYTLFCTIFRAVQLMYSTALSLGNADYALAVMSHLW